MVDEVPLRRAADTAWSVYVATHRGVHPYDRRRCVLERQLHKRWEARHGDVEQLTCFGLAFLERLPEEEC
jgi:hypothetical protein